MRGPYPTPATPAAWDAGCICGSACVHPDCWMHGKGKRASVERDDVRDPQPARLSGSAT
jgi:hypothetical protein